METPQCPSPYGHSPTTLLLVGHCLHPSHRMVRRLVWVVRCGHRRSIVSRSTSFTFLVSGFLRISSLPIGVFAFITTNITGYLPRYFDHKYIILFGGALLITASAMLPFTDSPDTYWKLSFPAFIIGTIGCTIVFSNSK